MVFYKKNQSISSSEITLKYPSIFDYKSWKFLREKSRAFLTPWEPTWRPGEHSFNRYLKLLSIYSQKRKNNLQYSFFIFNSDNELVGGVNVFNIKTGISQSCTLGYWIGQNHSRKGYMRNALKLLIKQLFLELKFNRIEAACIPRNIASKNLLINIGFEEEGYAKEFLRINGKWEDHLLFALTKNKYNEINNGQKS